jgi:hypothetical protein
MYTLVATGSEGSTSATLVVTVGAGAVEPPAAPADLAARAVSPTRVDLVWTDHAANEAGNIVERSVSGGPFADVALLPADAASWSDAGAQPNTRYTYRVRAWNDAGAAYSNRAAVRTPKK